MRGRFMHRLQNLGCHGINKDMRIFQIIIGLLLITMFISCKKEIDGSGDCFSNVATTGQITDQQATVINYSGKFYLVEKGTIDSKLNPCNLAREYQVNDLPVTISGEIKKQTQPAPGPCCTINFVITKISIR